MLLRLLLIICTFIFMGSIESGWAAKIEGFRDLQWGVEKSAVKADWVRVGEEKDDHLIKYKRKGEKMTMGDPAYEYRAPLTELSYGFFQGKLARVYFSSKGENYRNGILSEMAMQYGKAKSTTPQVYDWKTKKSWGFMLCVDKKQLCTGTIDSRKLMKEIKKYKKKLKKQQKK